MLLSVIIPAYNAAATIGRSLQSLESQTIPEWEAIVVDDGSTDQTASIVTSLAQKDSRIRLITQDHKQVSAARNTGLESAIGDWILFLDADDWVADNFIELMLDDKNHTCDAVICGWARVDGNGTIIHEKIPPHQEDMFPALAIYCPFAIHACIVRTALIRNVGGFDINLKTCEDWDLWQRIARSGARFKTVDKVLSFYLMRSSSLSKDGIQFFSDALQVLRMGHQKDDRVTAPLLAYENGLENSSLPTFEVYLLSWLAGILIGQNQNVDELFSLLKDGEIQPLEPAIIADNLIESLSVSTIKPITSLFTKWPEFEKGISNLLLRLEEISNTESLAMQTMALMKEKLNLNTNPL